VSKPANPDAFDPKTFLAKVGAGKEILEFQKGRNVFEQGRCRRHRVLHSRGKVKLTVLSEQGKEAVIAILEPDQFFGEGCMNGHKLRISYNGHIEVHSSLLSAVLHEKPLLKEQE
jgi:CRP-like cAMP-binding protein